jgi:hypothetical protein
MDSLSGDLHGTVNTTPVSRGEPLEKRKKNAEKNPVTKRSRSWRIVLGRKLRNA